jgi:hypothetical protein
MTGTIQEYLLRKGTDGKYQAPGAWIRPNSRKKLYKRDNYTCFYCGKDLHGASPQDITLDHLLSREDGGTNDPENLVTACRHCNSGLERKLEEMKRKVLRQHFGKSLAKSRSRKRLAKDWVNTAAPMAGRMIGGAFGYGDEGEAVGNAISSLRSGAGPAASAWQQTKEAVNPVIQYGQAMVGGTRLGRGKIGAVTNAALNAANFVTNPNRSSLTVAPAKLAIQAGQKLGLQLGKPRQDTPAISGSNRGKDIGGVVGTIAGNVLGIDGGKEIGESLGANAAAIRQAAGRAGSAVTGAIKNARSSIGNVVGGMTQGARRAISAPSTLAPVKRSLPVNRALWKSARIEARKRLGKSASSGIANVWARKWYEGRGGTWMRKAVLRNGSSSPSVATRPVVQPSSQPSSAQPAEQKTGRRAFLSKLVTGSISGALAARYGKDAVDAGIDAAAPAIQNTTGVDIRSLDSIRDTVPKAIHEYLTPGYASDKQGPINTPQEQVRRSLSSTRKRKRPW